MQTMIDIIIPIYNNLEYTKLFLESLKKQTFKNFSLIIINNGSTDWTKVFLDSIKTPFSTTIIHNKENLGYIKGINQGIKASKSPFILLGNNDTILPNNLLEKLEYNKDRCWILSVYSNAIDKINNSPLLTKYKWRVSLKNINRIARKLNQKFKNKIISVEFVFWHCMFIDRKVINKIGYLDEIFWIGNYDDQDYCKRAKESGFTIGLLQGAFIYHFCHTTFKSLNLDIEKILNENFRLFESKWW